MEHLLGVLTHTLWFIFQVPTKTLCTNSTGMRFVKHAPGHAHPTLPKPLCPWPLSFSGMPKYSTFGRECRPFPPRCVWSLRAWTEPVWVLTRFCLGCKSADKERWIHLKGKMRGISYTENRMFKVASPAADASWGVGDGKEEEGWLS